MLNNYTFSFLCCVALTAMAALGGSLHLKWLIMSDVNVAIWLIVACLFDPNR